MISKRDAEVRLVVDPDGMRPASEFVLDRQLFIVTDRDVEEPRERRFRLTARDDELLV